METSSEQKLAIPLTTIVPEYYSHSPLVRWLFFQRLRKAVCLIATMKPAVLLDLGCGDGTFIRLLQQNNLLPLELYAIDYNINVQNLTPQMPFCNFSRQDLMRTNFADHTFDAIVALDVLEHIQLIDKALAEIKRILKSQKFLLTREPTESVLYKILRFIAKGTFSMETGPGAGRHYYRAREIDTIIKNSGFKRINYQPIPFFYPLDLFHINLYQKI